MAALLQEAVERCPVPHDAQAQVVAAAAQLGARDPPGPRQVDDLAELREVVEPARPVVADGEDVDAVAPDVVDLLPLVLLDDHLVGQARGLDGLDPLIEGLAHEELAPHLVEPLGGDAHDEAVPQSARVAQEVDVSAVQEIVRAVRDDGDHYSFQSGGVGIFVAQGSSGCARRSAAHRRRTPRAPRSTA